jgi:trehalose 6-phosphate synthase/phosphatase
MNPSQPPAFMPQLPAPADGPGPAIGADLPLTAFLNEFGRASQRLLLLDFDGTLAPIVNNPADARLSDTLRQTLSTLSTQTDLVIISGRNRLFLEQTFSDLPVWLVAEHGAFLKIPDQPWQQPEPSDTRWQAAVRGLLATYVACFAGSFVEEKEMAIAWHYRMVEDNTVERQATELAVMLRGIPSVIPLHIIQGSKVVEIKPARYNKGTVAAAIAQRKPYGFILSIGDDTTDEDMFRQLPDWGFTVKVGPGHTLARYRLARQTEVELVLGLLTGYTSCSVCR